MQNNSPRLVPLAYVRRLAVVPAAIMSAPEAPLPLRPSASNKKALARWEERLRARQAVARLRTDTAVLLDEEIAARLGRVSGLTLVNPLPDKRLQAVWSSLSLPLPEASVRLLLQRTGREIEPFASPMEEIARSAQADAVLVAVMDRFGTHTGLERQIWLRLKAWLKPAGGRALSGPFYAYGLGRSGRKLFGFGKGYQKSDAQVARAASAQAARQLVHTLETGEGALFARDTRIAIVPAVTPMEVNKRSADTADRMPIPVPALRRQSDILLQPDIGPIAEIIPTDEVTEALKALDLRADDIWTTSGMPDSDAMSTLAAWLQADYIFVSRLTGVELSERSLTALDDGEARAGVARQADADAEAALYRTSDKRVLWSDKVSGSTTSRTAYVRHQSRIRTDEQCVVDSARIAFAYLRFSFDDFKKRFER